MTALCWWSALYTVVTTLYEVVTIFYAVVTTLYAVVTPLYAVGTTLYAVLPTVHAVLTPLYAVLTTLYAVLTTLYAVVPILYAVVGKLYTVVTTLYVFCWCRWWLVMVMMMIDVWDGGGSDSVNFGMLYRKLPNTVIIDNAPDTNWNSCCRHIIKVIWLKTLSEKNPPAIVCKLDRHYFINLWKVQSEEMMKLSVEWMK